MAKILVVDDQQANRDLLAYLLRGAGHTVTLAGDGPTAVASFAADRPDLVVVDLDMPVMDGFEVLGALRAVDATPPVVAVSALYEVSETSVRAAGFDAFFPLPLEPANLADVVGRLIAVIT